MGDSKKKTIEDLKNKVEILTEDLTVLENYVSNLFTFLPIPLCFASPQGVILEFNPAFEKVSGHKGFEATGENLREIFRKKDIEKIIKQTLEKGSVAAWETVLIQASGKKMPVSTFVRQRQDSNGQAIGFFLTVFDLTEIKATEQELQEKLEELEKFRKMAVGRELKMVELKEKIRQLEG